MSELHYYILLSSIIFSIGAVGVIIRRNAIVLMMCIELMLNGSNLALVAFSRYKNLFDGQVYVLLIMAIAAAEASIGLAIIISVFRNFASVNVDRINILKG